MWVQGCPIFFLCVCVLGPLIDHPALAVPSMSHAFGESYRVGSTKGVHAITVFCSWDYKVTQRWASRLQRDNIRTQLKVSGG